MYFVEEIVFLVKIYEQNVTSQVTATGGPLAPDSRLLSMRNSCRDVDRRTPAD